MDGLIIAPTHGYKGLKDDSINNVKNDRTHAADIYQKIAAISKKPPNKVPNNMRHHIFQDLTVIHEGNKKAGERRKMYLKEQDIRAKYNGVAFSQMDVRNLPQIQGLNNF